MDRPILFITRTWSGIGGMQRYSHDFWQILQVQHKGQVTLCAAASFMGLVTLPFRALQAGYRLKKEGGHVHLGDCSIMPIGVLLRCLFGLRFSVMTNGLDVFYAPWWYQRMIRFCFPYASAVICPAKHLEEKVIARGVRPALVRLIPYGIWPAEYERPITKHIAAPHLLTIGRLIPRKGVLWFLRDVFPSLLKQYPTMKYSIIGVGPDEAAVRSLIQQNKWHSSVRIRPQEEREQAFDEADVFVMPNIHVDGNGEGLPIVCLEAAARGVPVVAADLLGINESVTEGITGTLYQSDDAHSCVEAIKRMLSSSPDKKAMRQLIAEHHSWPLLLDRYEREVFSLTAS